MSTALSTGSLFDLIERSGLLAADQLAPFRMRSGSDPLLDAESQCRALIRDRLLTPFQARQLLRGRHQGFFLTEKYKILDHIGEGGMGRVLLCEHLLLHRLMAVKLLHLSGVSVPGAEERFLREARAAAAVDHPNIVRVYDVDRAGTTPFMVMEYVDGTNLHQLVAERGPLPIERAVEYVRQAAVGLHHAHRAGLVHRDIKPGNLLLDRSGTVKVLDLGLARFHIETGRNQNLTQKFDAASILGTADFVAPEQTMNSSRVDIRADLYSLGITFYYLLTGKMPFADGSPAQKILWHQSRDPIPVIELRPDVPDAVAAVLEKLIRKDPAERYQKPAEAVVALRPLVSAPVPPPPPEEMPKVRATVYQLGVSPPPTSAVLGAFHADPTTPPPIVGDTPSHLKNPVTPSTAEHIPMPSSPVRHLPAVLLSPVVRAAERAPLVPVLPAPLPPARAPRSLLAAVAVTVIAAVVAVSIWAALQPPSPPPAGPMGEPTTLAANAPLPVPPPQSPPDKRLVLKAGGSTFAAPVLQRWTAHYGERTGSKFEYEAVGSSQGVRKFLNRDYAFGCTDAPLTDAELLEVRGGKTDAIHVPLLFAPVAVAYNLPGAKEPVKFTGPVLAAIYLGHITRWNDERLTAKNPDLPDLPIKVFHRGDGSGTTSIWTDYLHKASPAWREKPRTGSAIDWPVGDAATGNDGLAAAVSRTIGGIGYVELSAARGNNLAVGLIQNRDGEFIDPRHLDGVKAAVNTFSPRVLDEPRLSLTDAPGRNSYPIVGTTWAVLHANQPAVAGRAVVQFLRWAIRDGQAELDKLKCVPLPADLAARTEAKLDRVTFKK